VLPFNLHAHGKLSDIPFYVTIVVGLLLTGAYAIKIPTEIKAAFPGNIAEQWRWAINFGLFALMLAIGFGMFLPL
jgi:hypothetical protein